MALAAAALSDTAISLLDTDLKSRNLSARGTSWTNVRDALQGS